MSKETTSKAPVLDGKNLTLETLKSYTGKLSTDTLKSITGKLKNKARIVISLRLAHSIAAQHKYEGTGFHATANAGDKNFHKDEKTGKVVSYEAKEGDFLYDKDLKPVNTTKYQNGYMNAQTKPTGGLWELDETSDLYEGILEAAKDANADISAGKYSNKVKELLELQLTTKESGTRSRDYSVAKDLW